MFTLVAFGLVVLAPILTWARSHRLERELKDLRARLAASGDLASAKGDEFDGGLEAAVRRMQARYGREPDGIVAATELAELNVSAGHRLQQIELNMERWRWLPKSLGGRYLAVNIPEYALHVYEGGKDVLDMRVVVGKVVGNAPGAAAGDIAWLKLEVASRRGSGVLTPVTTVQRINTHGGKLDGSCDAAGSFKSAPYSADYVFLRKG